MDNNLQPTELLYMKDSYLFEETAKVVSMSVHEDGRKIIVLDQTIFYPQGGGQRFDLGSIFTEDSLFKVEEIRFVEGQVLHIGNYEKGEFKIGDEVKLQIDKERRILHSKLQSAGHLIDMAVRHIGYENLVPAKGAHYPEWSEVEYHGEIKPDELETVSQKLQSDLDMMISQGYEVKIIMSSKEEAEIKCYIMPAQLPDNKPIRIVSVWDDMFMPCGGTHVKNVSDLKGLKITRVKSGKGVTKISYSI
jgi:Ser-tRNA(Ala) deacylase AlaX